MLLIAAAPRALGERPPAGGLRFDALLATAVQCRLVEQG